MFSGVNESGGQEMAYKSRAYWRNDRFSIFKIEEGWGPWYRGGLGIFRVMEKEGERGRVILYGRLPFIAGEGHGVVKLGCGETYEVVKMEYGQSPDNYRSGEVVVKFSDCQVRRSWVSRMVALGPRDVEHITGYVEVECDVEWNEALKIWEEGAILT